MHCNVGLNIKNPVEHKPVPVHQKCKPMLVKDDCGQTAVILMTPNDALFFQSDGLIMFATKDWVSKHCHFIRFLSEEDTVTFTGVIGP